MDSEALRIFVTVVESGSFLAAARALKLARATIRRRVEELEARARVALLERTRRGVAPTPAGAELARRGRLILQETNALLGTVREIGNEPAGMLRMLLPVGLPGWMLADGLARLRARFPRLRLSLGFADDPLAGLLGEIDFAVHFGDRVPEGPWVSYEALRVRERLLAARGYLDRHGTPANADELGAHELLAWQPADGDPSIWPTLAGGRVQVTPGLVSSDVHLLRHCAHRGVGIAFIPDAALPEPDAVELVPVLDDVIGRERSLRIVVPAALVDIPRIKVVLDGLREIMRVP